MRTRVELSNIQDIALVFEDSGLVVVNIKVVGRREESDQLAFGEELVAVFDDLVCTANEIHVVLLQEAGDNVRTKRERDTSVVFGPPGDVLVRIRPQQVAEQAAVRDL